LPPEVTSCWPKYTSAALNAPCVYDTIALCTLLRATVPGTLPNPHMPPNDTPPKVGLTYFTALFTCTPQTRLSSAPPADAFAGKPHASRPAGVFAPIAKAGIRSPTKSNWRPSVTVPQSPPSPTYACELNAAPGTVSVPSEVWNWLSSRKTAKLAPPRSSRPVSPHTSLRATPACNASWRRRAAPTPHCSYR
jgi:hypothetical protein